MEMYVKSMEDVLRAHNTRKWKREWRAAGGLALLEKKLQDKAEEVPKLCELVLF